MRLGQIGAVFRFEWNRAASTTRWVWWGAMVLFPVGLVCLLLYFNAPLDQAEDRGWGGLLFILIPDVVCLLGLLLWATPVVQTELEANSWIYLASRPGAKASVLLGKFLASVTWTFLAAVAGLTLCILLARPVGGIWMWVVLNGLAVLSCVSYGALYCLIGVLFHRRAMVAAVAYTVVVEFLVGFVPAVVNQFTIQFRLRSLLVRWMGWDQQIADRSDDLPLFFDTAPTWQHAAILVGFSVVALCTSIYLLHRREYINADEG